MYLAHSWSVAGQKKKTIVLLTAVALVGGTLLLCSAQSRTGSARSENSESGTDSLFANGAGFSHETTDAPGSGELFFKMMLSVLLVIVLGVAAMYISRKLLPRITNLPGKEICILETAHLGPRKAVHLVKIGNQRLLIGSTNESITTLADVTDGFAQGPDALADSSVQEIDSCAI